MLTGTSTRSDAVAQFRANLTYESDATGRMAREFVAAIRYLRAMPSRSKHPDAFDTEYDLTQLAGMEQQAADWLAVLPSSVSGLAAGSSLPRQFSFERFGR